MIMALAERDKQTANELFALTQHELQLTQNHVLLMEHQASSMDGR
jgi:hypothetical protein